MKYKKIIILVLVFSMVLGLFPLDSVKCLSPASAAYLVCRNCGYKETLSESSAMCAAVSGWFIKMIKEMIISLGKEVVSYFISKKIEEYNSSSSGKFRCPKCNSTNIYCDN